MPFTLQLRLNKRLYVRDPEQTELGRRMVDAAISLIDTEGFEKFTFRKLAAKIKSTEASVYRYFENKRSLLVYLVSWYWSWIAYRISFHTHSLGDPRDSLRKVVKVLAESTTYDPSFSHIDELALHRIMVMESTKTYQTKAVDSENQAGLFSGYTSLCDTISQLIHQVSPAYPYPKALASTVIEASHQQIFFAQHLSGLTELQIEGENFQPIVVYLESLLFGVLDAAAYKKSSD